MNNEGRTSNGQTADKTIEIRSNVHFLHIPNSDRPIRIYCPDSVISVGYRVKSKRDTPFRKLANKVLKEFIVKGHTINQRFERTENRTAETPDLKPERRQDGERTKTTKKEWKRRGPRLPASSELLSTAQHTTDKPDIKNHQKK